MFFFSAPYSMPELSAQSLWLTESVQHVVLTGPKEIWQEALRQNFHPARVTVHLSSEDQKKFWRLRSAFFADFDISGEPKAYVCFNRACQAPAATSQELVRLLECGKIKI
jgi:uncharacterized protein YyaL (SSP411 family)